MKAVLDRRIESDLQAIDIFSNLSDQELIYLSKMFHYVPLQAGHSLFEQGADGGSFYAICSGSVKAHVYDSTGEHELLLNEMHDGTVFGEISLILGIPRTCRITARHYTLLLEIRKAEFDIMLNIFPSLAKDINELLKGRIVQRFYSYGVPFFELIPADVLHTMGKYCEIETYIDDQVIFEADQKLNKFQIIVKGQAIATKINGGKSEVMDPGQYFGEDSLIKEASRTVTLSAVGKCVILSLTKENFEEFFLTCPEKMSSFYLKLAKHDAELSKVWFWFLICLYLSLFIIPMALFFLKSF